MLITKTLRNPVAGWLQRILSLGTEIWCCMNGFEKG